MRSLYFRLSLSNFFVCCKRFPPDGIIFFFMKWIDSVFKIKEKPLIILAHIIKGLILSLEKLSRLLRSRASDSKDYSVFKQLFY